MCHIFVRRSFTSKQHGEMIQFDGPHIFFRWGGLKPPTRYTSNPPFPNLSTEIHQVDVITRGLCVCHAASVNVEYVNVSGIDWVGGSSENVGFFRIWKNYFPENWTNVIECPLKRGPFQKDVIFPTIDFLQTCFQECFYGSPPPLILRSLSTT